MSDELHPHPERPQAADMAKIARDIMAELEKEKRTTG